MVATGPTQVRFRSRDGWLRARRIGSSDVAGLLGVSPYGGPWAVYSRLVLGEHDDEVTDAQLRGIRLEPRVLATYAQITGRRVERTPPHTLWTREEWSSSTPEARAGELLVEAKTDRKAHRWGPSDTIERWEPGCEQIVRPDYYLQVQHQLWTCDSHAADLAVLLPGDDPFIHELRVYRIERDEGVLERMIPRLREWWHRHVVERVEPEIDDSEAAQRHLARLARGGERKATDVEAELAREYERLARIEKDAKDAKKAAGRQLVQLADVRRLQLPGNGHVTIVQSVSSSTLDEALLLHEHPELGPLLDRYRKPGKPYSFPRVVPGRAA